MGLTSPLRYDEPADVTRRLHRTFIFYKGKAVFVNDCLGDLNIVCIPMTDLAYSKKSKEEELPKLEPFKIHSSDRDIDLESPELGWVNWKERPLYFMRTIQRQWQQGVNPSKCWYIDPHSPGDTLSAYFRYGHNAALVPFALMLENKGYPPIMEAAGEPGGAAFDRQWALIPIKRKGSGMRRLYHEGNAVGLFDIDTKEFLFARNALTKTRRQHLEEILDSPQHKGQFYVIKEQSADIS